jgi:aldose 1-epimerase
VTEVEPTVLRGAPGVRLRAGDYQATYLPGLGMLCASFEHRGDELLSLQGGLDTYRDGHTTGMPLLHPWANRLGSTEYKAAGQQVAFDAADVHTDPNGLPIHGTLHAHPEWKLVLAQAAERAAVLRARFDFGAHPDLLGSFPFPHQIEVEVKLTEDGLTTSTVVRPTSRRRVPISFGYHPWFRFPGVRRQQLRLELPNCTRVVLDEHGLPTGATEASPAHAEPLADRQLDDLFQIGTDRKVAISGGGRRLVVQLEKGYSHLQVFAPAGQSVVCLEPMTAPTNALVRGGCPEVKAGNSYLARFSLRVDAAAP